MARETRDAGGDVAAGGEPSLSEANANDGNGQRRSSKAITWLRRPTKEATNAEEEWELDAAPRAGWAPSRTVQELAKTRERFTVVSIGEGKSPRGDDVWVLSFVTQDGEPWIYGFEKGDSGRDGTIGRMMEEPLPRPARLLRLWRSYSVQPLSDSST
jgi:hypothetical protein